MPLLNQITDDYKQAMRDRDEIKKSALNFILSQIKYKKIELQKDPEDADIISVIKKEIKTINESIGFLQQANKQEETKIEEGKKAVLQSYLPTTLSPEATKQLITKLVTELAITDLKTGRGLLMKELMAQHRSEIDGQLVNEIINSMLAG